jgi:hypothetical protein
VVSLLAAVWEAAGYPWSLRLKALLPSWMPWIRQRYKLSAETEKQLLRIRARQIDRRLQAKKNPCKRRLYGRTRPGRLLKHHIPVKTDSWDVTTPGFAEIDLVSHSGNRGEGEFAHTLNLTDIHSGWTESRALLGKSQMAVQQALEEIPGGLPFRLLGLDSDNGSEFINWHLQRWCQQSQIQLTRGRPYKKDDNAHIEQKNWTHVRKLLGWERYDSRAAVEAINDLYRHELRLWLNLAAGRVRYARRLRLCRGQRQTALAGGHAHRPHQARGGASRRWQGRMAHLPAHLLFDSAQRGYQHGCPERTAAARGHFHYHEHVHTGGKPREARSCPSSGQGTLERGKIVNLYEVVLGEFDVSG